MVVEKSVKDLAVQRLAGTRTIQVVELSAYIVVGRAFEA